MSVRARASTVSRLLKDSWGNEDFPTVSQAGDAVLVEGGWRSLGWAANTLAMHGGYRVEVGGQWLSETQWNGWLEVRRGPIS